MKLIDTCDTTESARIALFVQADHDDVSVMVKTKSTLSGCVLIGLHTEDNKS